MCECVGVLFFGSLCFRMMDVIGIYVDPFFLSFLSSVLRFVTYWYFNIFSYFSQIFSDVSVFSLDAGAFLCTVTKTSYL